MIKSAPALAEWQRRAAALSASALDLLAAIATHDAAHRLAAAVAADPADLAAVSAVLEAFKEEKNA